VCGLGSRPEYNGRRGRVLQYDGAKQRYAVRLEQEEGGEAEVGAVLLLRTDNMRRLDAEEDEVDDEEGEENDEVDDEEGEEGEEGEEDMEDGDEDEKGEEREKGMGGARPVARA
jgi:hypothetical protein